jgi:hypothetical protein
MTRRVEHLRFNLLITEGLFAENEAHSSTMEQKFSNLADVGKFMPKPVSLKVAN